MNCSFIIPKELNHSLKNILGQFSKKNVDECISLLKSKSFLLWKVRLDKEKNQGKLATCGNFEESWNETERQSTLAWYNAYQGPTRETVVKVSSTWNIPSELKGRFISGKVKWFKICLKIKVGFLETKGIHT